MPRQSETRFTPSEASARQFRDALGRFATGVTVVTTRTERGPVGITANSFASVSLEPPLVLWSPARGSGRFTAFAGADRYAIHILGEEQSALCQHFTQNGDLDAIDWRPGADGIPHLEGCLARFDCQRTAAHDGGDHLIIVGRVLDCTVRNGAPLLFSAGSYGRFTERPEA